MNKPAELDPLAEEILQRLAGSPESSEIVLRGYFALKHYLDYRETHDIDAWWKSRANSATESLIQNAVRTVADEHLMQFEKRTFGDTASFELLRDGNRQFSFQIAVRSRELEPPVLSPWPPILIETLADNVGAKMNALVDRGAPRDMVDVHRLVQGRLVSIVDCWDLWRKKNPTGDAALAHDKVALHLNALESRRPLTKIADANERQRAQELREWFHREFLKP